MNRNFSLLAKASLVAILAASIVLPVRAESSAPETTIGTTHIKSDTLQGRESNRNEVKIQILDTTTNQPIANRSIEIESGNTFVINCIQAPCPSRILYWQGQTDAEGFINVPIGYIQGSTLINVEGYVGVELDRQPGDESMLSLMPDR